MSVSEAEQLFADFWEWRMIESPEFASFCGVHHYDDRLDDVSIAGYQRRGKAAEGFLARCQNLLKCDKLSDTERHNVTMLVDDLELFIRGLKYQGYLFPVSYTEGIQLDIELFISWMEFKTVDNFNTYICRLKALPLRVEQVENSLRYGVSVGLVQHHQSMLGVMEEFEALETPVEDTVFFQPFVVASEYLDLTSQKEEAKRVIQEEVQPAYKKLKDYINQGYMNHLRPDEGVSCLPNGGEFYQECLRWHLSMDMTPDQVHQRGLQEIKRIKAEMEEVIKKTGFEGSFTEFLDHLRNTDSFYFKTKESLLEGYRNMCDNIIRPQLGKLFRKMPKSKLIIEATPESRANAPAGYYLAGTLDGARPGKFYLNTNNLKMCPNYEMVTLSLHEGEPGHHFQGMYAIEMEGVPMFRQYLEDMNYFAVPSRFPLHTAYMEGWGLYCEYLGKELGLYGDPYSMFGHLSFEMHRACRLVVDTGIHAFGWNFDKAKSLLMENTALGEPFLDSEVRRYITWPGQACAYKVGELKIKELRRRAGEELDAKFDVRDFHDEVLRCGMTPLTVLESAVDRYIQTKKP